jgi:hypothetical protein
LTLLKYRRLATPFVPRSTAARDLLGKSCETAEFTETFEKNSFTL